MLNLTHKPMTGCYLSEMADVLRDPQEGPAPGARVGSATWPAVKRDRKRTRVNRENPALVRDNTGMTTATPNELPVPAFEDLLTPKEMELLTPKELEIERKAKLEELKKRSWMQQSAAQLTSRVPVSVFAMGGLIAGD